MDGILSGRTGENMWNNLGEHEQLPSISIGNLSVYGSTILGNFNNMDLFQDTWSDVHSGKRQITSPEWFTIWSLE